MKPKVSVLIPTLGRDTLYLLIKKILKQKVDFDYEIVLLPQRPLREDELKDKKIRFRYEKLGKGFAYYRNVLIKMARGDTLVWIDDDEEPMDDKWLENIVRPILDKKEKVTTAGVYIKLGQGYLTDSISLLGFPGGGAVGFETMWEVDSRNYTSHLCSGNFAIEKRTILSIKGFSKNLKFGSEDVDLADKIVGKKIKIKYIKNAAVYHVARRGLVNFVKWNFLRGKSAAHYLKKKKSDKKVGGRLASSKRILAKVLKTKYFFGVVFLMIIQYVCQIAGFLVGRARR